MNGHDASCPYADDYDKRCRRFLLLGVWGCPPYFLSTPKFGG